jgi:hydroxymethylglutaryl-CoA lyase
VKVELFEALVAAGITELELTSFVRPDRVPAMADAEALCAATNGTDVARWGLVLNLRGAQRALDAGLAHLQFVVSVSDAHSRHNAGASTLDAFDAFAAVAELATASGAAIELTLATAFGCPFTGPVDPEAVVALAGRAVDAAATAISLADTIGTGVPTEVRDLVGAVRAASGLPVGVHLHDTRGLAIPNALAAIDAGAVRVDGSVGALGGCPFAPGASGNLALEDLVHALEAMGTPTGVALDSLIDAAELACGAVGRPVGSHVGIAGARFTRQATA